MLIVCNQVVHAHCRQLQAAHAAMLLETPAEEAAGRQVAKAQDMYSLALLQPLAELEAIAAVCPSLLQPDQKGEGPRQGISTHHV